MPTTPASRAPSRPASASTPTLLGLAALLWLGGCDEGRVASFASGTGGVQRLDFSVPGREPRDRSIRLARRIELPRHAEEWSPRAEQVAFFPGGDGRPPALVLTGKDDLWIDVPIPAGTPRYNIVAVELTNPSQTTASIEAFAQGRSLLSSKFLSLNGTQEAQVLLVELPAIELSTVAPEFLRVRLDGKSRVQAIHRIELLHRDLATFLPDPDGRPQPVEVARHDARLAVGLTSDSPLSSSFQVAEGARLRLAYGLPRSLVGGSDGSDRLVIEVRDDRGRSRHTRQVDLEREALTQGWQELELPLTKVAGRAATLHLSLESRARGPRLLAIGEARVVVPQASPPTVLLVTSDTHRYDHVAGAERGVDVRTPSLDALAARGVFFTDCFSTTNVTNPSHVSLLTGRHPRDTGVLDNNTPIDPEAPTLALRFREAGYRTLASLSARHLGHDSSGLGGGFDRMGRPTRSQRRANETIDEVLAWSQALADEPLFVWLHVFDAHTPYEPPPEHLARQWPAGQDPFDPRLSEPPDLPPSIFGPGGTYAGLRDLEFPRAQYRAEVESLDEQLARVLDHPRLGQGVVALTADHGESLGHHDCFYDHAGLYPDTIHVPLTLSWPGGVSGERVERPVTQLDLGRTILDLAGLASAAFPGRNLVAPLLGAPEPPPEPRFTLSSNSLTAAVSSGDWHLILTLVANAPHPDSIRRRYEHHQVQLFDLARDPACERDLVDEFPEIARRLRRSLVRWLTSPEPTGWARAGTNDEETLRQLTELGYTLADFGAPPQGVRWEPDACEWCRRYEP